MKKLGQYFTTDETLKQKVYEFIKNNPSSILEPSVGKGHLVEYVQKKNKDVQFECYEIDESIISLENVKITYGDFLTKEIGMQTTIIGNPPFVRTKHGNLYLDFVEKCYSLLNQNGELIFIVPSDFFKLTSASKLLDKMMIGGTFTHIYYPKNERLFENASIDVIVFRYLKNSDIDKIVNYNDVPMFIINNDGMLTFENTESVGNHFKDFFDIYVGLVSGKEEVFKNSIGNFVVMNGKDKFDTYINIKKFPSQDEEINKILLCGKQTLLARRIRRFNEDNWFEWGALRNVDAMETYAGKPCIYVKNLTRKPEPAFIGTVSYFGGSLLMLIPKKSIDLNTVVNYINSEKFKSNFMFSGRFKLGHRQLCKSVLKI